MIPITNLITVLAALTVLILAYFFALVFLAKAKSLVRRQAEFYRSQYKEKLKMPDEEIDKRVTAIWFGFLIDSMSHFVNRGPEHPEEFPRLVFYYRAIGCFFLVFIIAVSLIILYAAIMGGLRIGTSG